jgi:enediyne biosynthesis protein E11
VSSSYSRCIDPELLADLRAEHAVLDRLLSDLHASQWSTATPAAGWNVSDQIRHLATSERAATLALEGRGAEVFRGQTKLDPIEAEDPHALLEAWRRARERTVVLLASVDDRARVTWGAGPMSARSFAEARLMETWAHGLDCFAAVGTEPVDTPRLHRIAGLALRALPYAFDVAGRDPPGDVRGVALDLDGPSGERWWIGPEPAHDVISGSASEWCRVATRRVRPETTSLRAATPLAAEAIQVARAYLVDAAL